MFVEDDVFVGEEEAVLGAEKECFVRKNWRAYQDMDSLGRASVRREDTIMAFKVAFRSIGALPSAALSNGDRVSDGDSLCF